MHELILAVLDGPMTRRAHDLVDEHDPEPEPIEGVPWRHGADADVPDSDHFVGAGVVARPAESRSRYAASFFDLLWEISRSFTVAAVDRFRAASGTDERAVHYHPADLDPDPGR